MRIVHIRKQRSTRLRFGPERFTTLHKPIDALDALRPRLRQLRQLVELIEDTEMALGSDLMSIALEGYALPKVAGKGEARKGARSALAVRFRGQQRRAAEPALTE